MCELSSRYTEPRTYRECAETRVQKGLGRQFIAEVKHEVYDQLISESVNIPDIQSQIPT